MTGKGRKQLTNWSANITYTSDVVHEVTSIAEIQDLLKSNLKVKPFGTGHTFNSITDTLHYRISLKQLYPEEPIHLDPSSRTVTISAGVRYDELCPYLHDRGFALSNLPSITELSVVGACSTGAHGSGDKCGSLATAVSALEIVTGDGKVVKLSRDADGDGVFAGAVVGLGALGVVTKLTLDVEPQFTMRQWVYEGLPMEELTEHFEEIMACGYSVSLFTDWKGERVHQMWVKLRDDTPFSTPQTLFGAQRQTAPLRLTRGAHFDHCTVQMGLPGPSHSRLPHFRPGSLLPTGSELHSEYFLPRRHAVSAVLAISALRHLITPHLFMSEIRTIAKDDLWMSPCYGRDSVSIQFTWKHHEREVGKVVKEIEKALAEFEVRPHWGKMFGVEVMGMYEKGEAFRELAGRWDPEGKLRNAFLEENVLGRRKTTTSLGVKSKL